MREYAYFGPSGNSESFLEQGYKHTWQAMKWLSELGLDAYEYSGGNGIVGGKAVFYKIGEEAKKYNISLSLHTPYYISLSSVEREYREKSIGYIKKSLDAAYFMGADTIVIHTGSAAKLVREQAMDYARETLGKVLETLDIGGIRLGLETMGKLNQLGTLEEVTELCKMDERLYPVVDFGHLNARNIGNLFNTPDDYRRVFDKIGCELGDEKAIYLHCHFSKIEYTRAGERRHSTFADTEYGPPFEPLIEAIILEKVKPRIICESNGTMAEDALQMKQYYLNLKEEKEG